MMSWTNQEDFEKDLYLFSENEGSPNDEPEPLPITIAQWNALKGSSREQSIYDTIPYDSGVIFISSGRGRGCRSELYRPGAPITYDSTSEDDDIRKRLREINSDCHSNINIEATYRIKARTPIIDEFCDANETESNININQRTLQDGMFSPITQDSSSSSPVITEEKEKTTQLLPLNQMRQLARQIPEQKLYSQVLKEKNISHSKNVC